MQRQGASLSQNIVYKCEGLLARTERVSVYNLPLERKGMNTSHWHWQSFVLGVEFYNTRIQYMKRYECMLCSHCQELSSNLTGTHFLLGIPTGESGKRLRTVAGTIHIVNSDGVSSPEAFHTTETGCCNLSTGKTRTLSLTFTSKTTRYYLVSTKNVRNSSTVNRRLSLVS